MFRDTKTLYNAYNHFGNVQYVDHWFGALEFAQPPMRNSDEVGRVVEKTSLVRKSRGKPFWFMPVVQLECRKYERLSMDAKVDMAIITCPHTRFDNNFAPQKAIEVERLARKKPKRDWRIETLEAFESLIYQRQGRNKWVLIAVGKGFA